VPDTRSPPVRGVKTIWIVLMKLYILLAYRGVPRVILWVKFSQGGYGYTVPFSTTTCGDSGIFSKLYVYILDYL
jgi:hypothetical protein